MYIEFGKKGGLKQKPGNKNGDFLGSKGTSEYTDRYENTENPKDRTKFFDVDLTNIFPLNPLIIEFIK